MHVQVEEATKSRQDQDKYKEGQEKTKEHKLTQFAPHPLVGAANCVYFKEVKI
jgi:hypothetical protein